MNKREKGQIQDICLAKSGIGSTFIDPPSIVTAHWTRFKCQYGCPSYNKNLCCPPYAPALRTTRNIIAEYETGLLVHFGGDVRVSEAIADIERELFLENYHKVIGFGAGPCRLCTECTLEGCLFPERARPSMEACGIDVFATLKNNGLSVEVLASPDEQVNCHGLLLIE